VNFQRLKIEPTSGRRGRTFSVALLNYITADCLWPLGASSPDREVHRPVYLSYAGTDQEVTAFTANLRSGRKAMVYSEYDHCTMYSLEVPRSAGFKFVRQQLSDGALAMTVYLPELWRIEPEVLPDKISFLFAPPCWWLDLQAPRLKLEHGSGPNAQRQAAIASYFAAFLDRRSPLPIINETAFHQRLWRAAREEDWLIEPHGYQGNRGKLYVYPDRVNKERTQLAGLELVRLVHVEHSAFAAFLGRQVELYRKERPVATVPAVKKLHAANRAFQLGLFDSEMAEVAACG